MTKLTIKEKMDRRRNRKISGMVYTVARKCHDADFTSGIPSHLHWNYAGDMGIWNIVARLYDDLNVSNIQIPARAFKLYSDGKD